MAQPAKTKSWFHNEMRLCPAWHPSGCYKVQAKTAKSKPQNKNHTMKPAHITHHAHPRAGGFPPAFYRGPWAGFDTQIERMLDRAFGSAEGFGAGGYFPVDLYEDKDNTYVRAALPGVARGDINVELADGVLNISATRKTKTKDGEQTVSFKRSVLVPESTDGEKITAACENGELTVTLPKREPAKPRAISITVS
jgi:HSP20 family protein